MLPAYLNVPESADTAKDALRYGEWGKPYLKSPLSDIYYSYSHSGTYQALIFAEFEVGLDIEDIMRQNARSGDRLIKIAKRYFTQDEREYMALESNNNRLINAFFRIWTGKESYVKYTGMGFRQGFTKFSVLDPPEGAIIEMVDITGAPQIACSIAYGRQASPLPASADNVTIIYYDQ